MLNAIRNTAARFFGRKKIAVNARAFDMLQERYSRLKATYDAARTTDEFKNIWANADKYDADSAHSKDVRHSLISRSRHEVGNNGYADGIASTYANDLIGVGPTLRMQTGSENFNRMVETQWYLWCKQVNFRRKLWCMAHAKHVDGEAFAVIRRNPGINHPVKLDLVLHEAEQVQTPFLPFTEAGYIDGIKFDEFGNPLWYDVLSQHPGTSNGLLYEAKAERVPADMMLHWFKMRRPGQHRAVPECASTLNTGAAARRWREDVLSAADRAALLTLMMQTQMTPDEADQVAPFSTMDIEKGMMSFLPEGWQPHQLDSKFPGVTHAEFSKSLINEQARPKSMPYNKAACDSSSYNYASGRLDHQTYYASLDVDREDGNDLALDRLFQVWFNVAIVRFNWLGGEPEQVGQIARFHLWDWPKHRVADVESEANANETKLKSGQIFPHTLFSDAGIDFEDELAKAATTYGIEPDELRKRLLDVILPPVQQGGNGGDPSQPSSATDAVAAILRGINRRNELPKANGNGVAHAN